MLLTKNKTYTLNNARDAWIRPIKNKNKKKHKKLVIINLHHTCKNLKTQNAANSSMLPINLLHTLGQYGTSSR